MKTLGWLLVLFGCVLVRAALKGQVLDQAGGFALFSNLTAEATALITGDAGTLAQLDATGPGAGILRPSDITVTATAGAAGVAPAETGGETVELNPLGAGNWQCAVSGGGVWYVSEAVASGARFHRLNAKGQAMDSMIGVGFKHPTSFSASGGNLYATAGNGRIVRFPYTPGKKITHGDCTDTPWSGEISLDASRSVGVIRNGNHYKRVNLGNSTVTGTVTTPAGARQGFGMSGDTLYVLTGATNKPARVDKYSFTTGKHVGTVDVTSLGAGTKHREPEGMDGNLMGVKVNTGSARRLRIYRVTL